MIQIYKSLYGNTTVTVVLGRSVILIFCELKSTLVIPCCCVVFVCPLLGPIYLDFGVLSFCGFPLPKQKQGCALISEVPAVQRE